MRTFALLVALVAFVAGTSAFVPAAVRPGNAPPNLCPGRCGSPSLCLASPARWALRSTVSEPDLDAETAAELKKLEKEAMDRLDEKLKELKTVVDKE